jgi:ABC-2 type transport system permease protein
MTLVLAHFRAATLELLRYPSFSLPTLLFPAAFFLLVGMRFAREEPDAAMASFAAFAILGVAFFQFGVGIAAERASPWHAFLRVLPAPVGVRFAAKVLSALAFGAASAAVVVVAAVAATDAGLAPSGWARLGSALLAGAIPFALLGIALGYWLSPRGALPAANLLYLALGYAGGLWTGAGRLPESVAAISAYLPTRLWGDELAAAVGAGDTRPARWLALLGYAAAFASLAAWGYRRDEGERFR